MSERDDSAEHSGEGDHRAGFVALIGAPNAGKSTLINLLVGAKVSIVTRKVQTTRAQIRGIAVFEETQIVFVDTPGIFEPRKALDRAMVDAAWGGARDADVIVLLVDAQRGVTKDVKRILANLKSVARPCVLCLNKIDLVERRFLLALTQEITEMQAFEQVYYISSLSGEGIDGLTDYLKSQMPPGPWLYPQDQLTDAPLRHTAAEITREKLYLRMHDELPYAVTVETVDWKEQKNGSIRIEQVIYVQRSSQKKIVLGKNGSAIKAISMAARRELGELLNKQVHLFLFVKVRERWGEDPERYREMGLDFPKG